MKKKFLEKVKQNNFIGKRAKLCNFTKLEILDPRLKVINLFKSNTHETLVTISGSNFP